MQERPAEEIWNYQQIGLGYNYRLTDIQAALGFSQLSRLPEFVNRRHEIAQRYDHVLASMQVVRPWQHPDTWSSYHLYPIRIRENQCRKTHRQIYDAFLAAGIGVNLHYIPVYRQPYFEAMGFTIGYCREAERYYREALSIPIFPDLDNESQEKVIDVLAGLI